MSNPKYRPYFTLPALEEIISCLKEHPNPRRLQIARYLDGYVLSVKMGVRSANYLPAPTMLEKLELETPVPLSHEITGEAAYNMWITSPAKCSVQVVEEAMSWAYANDKLTSEQEQEYEKNLGL